MTKQPSKPAMAVKTTRDWEWVNIHFKWIRQLNNLSFPRTNQQTNYREQRDHQKIMEWDPSNWFSSFSAYLSIWDVATSSSEDNLINSRHLREK